MNRQLPLGLLTQEEQAAFEIDKIRFEYGFKPKTPQGEQYARERTPTTHHFATPHKTNSTAGIGHD